MRRGVSVLSHLILLFGLVHALGAGTLEARQTPADTAAITLDVAGTLEAEGKGKAARALLELIVRRYPGTPAAAEASLRLAALDRYDADGSTELRVWSTIYGAWLGVAVPLMLDANDPAAYGVGLLAGSPIAFLAAHRYTRASPVSEGQARAITFGGTWGAWQGYGWRKILDLGTERERYCPEPTVCFETEEVSAETVVASIVIGSLAGIGTGLVLAETQEISAGAATAATLGALWGTWYGAMAGILADLEGDEHLASMLIGGNIGLVGTALAVRGSEITRSRARLVSVAGVAGAAAGIGIDLIFQVEDETISALIPTVTSALGLGLGMRWTRDRDDAHDESPSAPGALIDFRDGILALGTPLPTLRLVPDRHGRPTAGVGLELVRARF